MDWDFGDWSEFHDPDYTLDDGREYKDHDRNKPDEGPDEWSDDNC